MRVALPIVCLLSSAALAAPTFDKTLAPPRAFAGIRAGAALDAAKSALATFHDDAAYSDAMGRHRLVRDAGDGALYYVLVENDVIARIGVEAPAAGLEPRLAKLWGEPAHVESMAHEAIASWSDGARRVDLACREARCRLAFHELLGAGYFGAAVAPPGELAKVAPGMTRDEVRALAPHHAGGGVVPAGFEDVRTSVDFDSGGRVRGIAVGGLPASGRALLERAWGAPAQTTRGLVWLATNGWRAVYDEPLRTLQLSPYLPVAQLLGSGLGIAALPRPVLGATPAQIAAAYPSFRGSTLDLPPTEAAALATTVQVDVDKSGRATALTIPLAFENVARRTALLALLEAKWGTPVRRTEGTTRIYAYPVPKLAIEAREIAGALELRLRLP